MALSDLLSNSFLGVNRPAPDSTAPATGAPPAGGGLGGAGFLGGFPGLFGGIGGTVHPATPVTPTAPQPPPGVAMPAPPVMTTIVPGFIPPIVFRPPAPQPHVATDLARRAIDQLRAAGDGPIGDAIAAAHNASIPATGLMAFLARKVLVGEVLGGTAATWSDETRRDMADALNIAVDRRDVMDAVASLAVLNDPDLEQEMRGEHLVQPSEADLLGGRRVVWQHPPAGTPLQPPYVILVAVEHQQVAEAQEVVDAILGELVERNGFRVPQMRFRPQDMVSATLLDRPLLTDRLTARRIVP